MPPLLIAIPTVFGGLFGLVLGSFFNVVIWRLPRGESLVRPRSACPHCCAQIRAVDNVPLLSWLVLGGRCRSCREPISPRYPLVELATGVGFALVTWWFTPRLLTAGSNAEVVSLALTCIAFLLLVSVTVMLTLIDIDVHRLPDVIVLPSLVASALLLSAARLVVHDLAGLERMLLAAAIVFAAFWVMVRLSPRGMGAGDKKLAPLLALFLGSTSWGSVYVGFFLAFLLGGVIGGIVLLVRRRGLRTRIPFGPWLFAGTWLGLLAGEPIAAWYLGLFGTL